ncbi:hypothetical protein QTI51_23070 [Variovorax sp. J22G73]|uniref:hypothetical protein n=1 Tax=unclassified Variovorax TaxID=663243 RepID=UPI0025779208|nr:MULTISPECIES: hypothetical protein [unclassified Variovorax]MDM0007458.1 hypothetical protein [Variovorax sp. J22R203]MDM0100183.1 hypothetical protein [Variovorax sp. J22G73]
MDALLDLVANDSALFSQMTDLRRASVRPTTEHFEGANWTVRSDTNIDQFRPEIARAIRELQARFDLAD